MNNVLKLSIVAEQHGIKSKNEIVRNIDMLSPVTSLWLNKPYGRVSYMARSAKSTDIPKSNPNPWCVFKIEKG